MPELEFVFATCPECGSISEVVDEWTAESTDGPVAYRATLCLERHRLYALVDSSTPPPKE